MTRPECGDTEGGLVKKATTKAFVDFAAVKEAGGDAEKKGMDINNVVLKLEEGPTAPITQSILVDANCAAAAHLSVLLSNQPCKWCDTAICNAESMDVFPVLITPPARKQRACQR
jgi:hypothetical protein